MSLKPGTSALKVFGTFMFFFDTKPLAADTQCSLWLKLKNHFTVTRSNFEVEVYSNFSCLYFISISKNNIINNDNNVFSVI